MSEEHAKLKDLAGRHKLTGVWFGSMNSSLSQYHHGGFSDYNFYGETRAKITLDGNTFEINLIKEDCKNFCNNPVFWTEEEPPQFEAVEVNCVVEEPTDENHQWCGLTIYDVETGQTLLRMGAMNCNSDDPWHIDRVLDYKPKNYAPNYKLSDFSGEPLNPDYDPDSPQSNGKWWQYKGQAVWQKTDVNGDQTITVNLADRSRGEAEIWRNAHIIVSGKRFDVVRFQWGTAYEAKASYRDEGLERLSKDTGDSVEELSKLLDESFHWVSADAKIKWQAMQPE